MAEPETGGAPGTWRRFLYDRSPTVFRSHWGVRLMGTMGLLWDTASQAALDSFLGRILVRKDGPAYDALRPIGEERSMPQYATETWVQFRSRLRDAWPSWEEAGDENTITRQLELAGFPGAQVFRWPKDDSWSEFAVFFPDGVHSVTSPGPAYGSAGNYGDDGLFYGPVGITPEAIHTIKHIILHWKPARWKCRFVVWEISGATYGTGHTYGETDLVYGGEQALSEVQP